MFTLWPDRWGVNPARAGMIPFEIDMLHARHRKPRASGDDPPGEGGVPPTI